MLTKGAAKKVTIYVNEDARYHLGPLHESTLLFLLHRGVACSTASRAPGGVGARHVTATFKIEALAAQPALRFEFG